LTNQLVDEALPDLSEFDAMSIVDIAYAITLWPEGSPDQLRAVEAIRARAPGIGHNRPPLAERLETDFAELKVKADLAIATKPVIVDQESAGKVLDLMKTMRDLAGEANTLRLRLQKPYQDAAQAIAAASETVRGPLLAAVPGLQAMLTTWDDKLRAEAAERQRLARAEQAQREAAAAEALRKANEAADAGKSTVIADKAAEHLREEAEKAAIRAEAIRPEPTRGTLGQGSRRKVIKFKVENIREVLGELLRDPGDRARIEEATDTIVAAKLRTVGVAAVERGITIKGLKAWVELGAVTARR
jgi:hypothetical protein